MQIGLGMASKRKRPISEQGIQPTPEVSAELIHAMREIVRYAIMTMNALRDPDRRYLGWARMSVNVVHDVQAAYGYTSTWVRRFHPTPRDIAQMEIVAPWLAWLSQNEGRDAVRRIISWSLGVALWRIGQREQCSDRTVMNRIDRSIVNIIKNFTGANLPVEHIEEPYQGVRYALICEKPPGPVGDEVVLMKIYIGGMGMWKAGKYLRDGMDKIDRMRRRA